jgi:hypothetical protein
MIIIRYYMNLCTLGGHFDVNRIRVNNIQFERWAGFLMLLGLIVRVVNIQLGRCCLGEYIMNNFWKISSI